MTTWIVRGARRRVYPRCSVGSIARSNRVDRFIAEFGDLALEEYGLPPGTYAHQAIGIEDGFEIARIFVSLIFPSGTYELMMNKVIFDPEQLGSDLVDHICQDYENAGISREEVIERLKKADLIDQEYNDG